MQNSGAILDQHLGGTVNIIYSPDGYNNQPNNLELDADQLRSYSYAYTKNNTDKRRRIDNNKKKEGKQRH